MMYVEFMKNFLLADLSVQLAVRLILASWAQKRLIPTFLDMMYVVFMKNFLPADLSELLAVRLILASWAQKRIKRFWAQEAKMSLTANSSLRSAGRKFFMNTTYIMSKKVGINPTF